MPADGAPRRGARGRAALPLPSSSSAGRRGSFQKAPSGPRWPGSRQGGGAGRAPRPRLGSSPRRPPLSPASALRRSSCPEPLPRRVRFHGLTKKKHIKALFFFFFPSKNVLKRMIRSGVVLKLRVKMSSCASAYTLLCQNLSH